MLWTIVCVCLLMLTSWLHASSNQFIHTLYRLEKLLMEQKFEEAFLLAAQYGLDREVSEERCVRMSKYIWI